MMASDIPIISITQESDREDEMSDNESTPAPNANIKDACTDIEDLDSEDGAPGNLLQQKRRKSSLKRAAGAVTDVEDFEDPCSDNDSDEVESVGDKFSLTEFLDQGFVDETWSRDGKDKLKHTRRSKRSSLLPNLQDDGGITDCENYETDEDIDVVEINDDANIYDDILVTADDFNTVSTLGASMRANRKDWRKSCERNVDQSDSDDELPHSDVENIALSDSENRPAKRHVHVHKMRHSKSALDAEEITLVASDTEDIAAVSERKSTCPHIDIHFHSFNCDGLRSRRTGTRKKASSNALSVLQTKQEALTDVEDLDSSDDDKDNIRKSAKIPIAYVVDPESVNIPTDVEDFDVDEECLPSCSKDIRLPSPVREIKLIKEDEKGDPVSRVMPLVAGASGNFLGIEEHYIDKGLTDTEDMSDGEEIEEEQEFDMPEIASFDGGIVSSVEGVSEARRNKKPHVDGCEPVTDVEEMGTASKGPRRRKTKPKCKSLLNVGEAEGGVTDTEELCVSDDQLARLNISDRQRARLRAGNADGGKTDTEDVSDDEDMIIENLSMPSDIDPDVLRQDAFFSTIMSSESASADNQKENYSKISTVIKTKEMSLQSSELSLTDVEDVHVLSETDDMLTVDDTYSRANTATPMELRSAFNEGANFSIHDRTTHVFDHSIEANHIKGYTDLQDSHTDIETLDDDRNAK